MEAAVVGGQEVAGGEGLAQVVERFRRWRDGRVAGARIPVQLWDAAVAMAKVHGVPSVSKALGLDGKRLKRRVEFAAGHVQPTQAAQPQAKFVEMFAPPTSVAVTHACLLELQNARGATMRVHLHSAGLSALAGVCSAFLGAL